MEKIALRQADAILSVSDYTARRTRDLFGLSGEIMTVHNAVNVPLHYPRKTDYQERNAQFISARLLRRRACLHSPRRGAGSIEHIWIGGSR